MSTFVKGIDPNHLVMANTWGYFGARYWPPISHELERKLPGV